MAYRPTEKTEAHRSAQQALLLKSATAIVTHSGFQGLTISAVAKNADMATGTVYKYFDSKAHLCTEVFRCATSREVEQVRLAAFPDDNSACRQRLINAITTFSERALQADRLAYALIAEPTDPMIEAERLIYRQAYGDIYAELIREGIQKKEFPEQSVAVSSTALVGVIAETLIAPLGRNRGSGANAKEQQDLLDSLKQFCLRAVTGMPA